MLDRLLDLSAARGLPITLAVIPDGSFDGLHQAMSRPRVSAAQHGTDHRNRGVGASSQFSPGAPMDQIVADLSRGLARLSDLPGMLPCYVPPWNALDPHVEAALVPAGFSAVSASGGERLCGPLRRLDVHVDILRWKEGPRFRGEASVLRRLTDRFESLRKAGCWREPTGVLTHHLVHDAAAWDFLESASEGCFADPRLAWTDLAAETRADVAVCDLLPTAPRSSAAGA